MSVKSPAGVAALLRRAAMAVAAGRIALGVTAVVRPDLPARPWVGEASDDLSIRVLARALGARDIALGLGAAAAVRQETSEPGSTDTWLAAGALSDALDVCVTLALWRELPRRGRWTVVASAGTAALIGAAAALSTATR
jgi:hypothetical protein